MLGASLSQIPGIAPPARLLNTIGGSCAPAVDLVILPLSVVPVTIRPSVLASPVLTVMRVLALVHFTAGVGVLAFAMLEVEHVLSNVQLAVVIPAFACTMRLQTSVYLLHVA